jgi:hypothetical protein
MKRLIPIVIALSIWPSVAVAEAINITLAEVQNGVAVVQGNKAAKQATISWETSNVGQTSNGGSFRFSGIVPADCVGQLSIGVDTIDVALANCTPQVSSVPAPVPKTGQIRCSDATGATILCSGTGQDGELQQGVTLPTPRFTDNNNGTFTDNLTGLVWLRNANCNAGQHNTWQDALDGVASLNATGAMFGNDCGDTSNNGTHQTDWRLPNIRELLSLLDYRFSGPPLSNAAGTGQAQCEPIVDCPFSPFASFRLWSSTTNAGVLSQAWTVDLESQSGILQFAIDKSALRSILAVRGGS